MRISNQNSVNLVNFNNKESSSCKKPNFTSVFPVKVLVNENPVNDCTIVTRAARKLLKQLRTAQSKESYALSKLDPDYANALTRQGIEKGQLVKYILKDNVLYLLTGSQAWNLDSAGKQIGWTHTEQAMRNYGNELKKCLATVCDRVLETRIGISKGASAKIEIQAFGIEHPPVEDLVLTPPPLTPRDRRKAQSVDTLPIQYK